MTQTSMMNRSPIPGFHLTTVDYHQGNMVKPKMALVSEKPFLYSGEHMVIPVETARPINDRTFQMIGLPVDTHRSLSQFPKFEVFG